MNQLNNHSLINYISEFNNKDLKQKLFQIHQNSQINKPFNDGLQNNFKIKEETCKLVRLATFNKELQFEIQTQMEPSPIFNDKVVLCALNIIFNNIEMVERICEIKTQQMNHQWAIWICDGGEWKIVEIDDCVPAIVDGSNQKLATIQSDYIWPILIEKAIIRFYSNNYSYLSNHLMLDNIIYCLTGLPIQKIVIKENNNLQEIIDEYSEQNQVLYVQQGDNGYSILGTKQEVDQTLIILKAAVKDMIPQQRYKGGQQFTYTIEEFKNEFDQLSIIRYDSTYKYSWFNMIPIEQREKQNEFIEYKYGVKFEIEEESLGFIKICQKGDSNSDQGLGRVLICKHMPETNYEYDFVSGDFSQIKDLNMEVNLSKGAYYLSAHIYFKLPITNPNSSQVILQFYASNPPQKIDQVNKKGEEFRSFQTDMLLSFIQYEKKQSPGSIRTFEKFNQPNITVATLMNIGMLIFYYNNLGSQTLTEQVTFEKCENLITFDTLEKRLQFKVNVKCTYSYVELYIFDPTIALTNKYALFQYTCNINSHLKNIEISNNQDIRRNQMSESHCQQTVSNSLQNQQDNIAEVGQFMKQNGKQIKRKYKDKEIEVYYYQNQSSLGVIIMYQNLTNQVYEEKIQFQLDNLELNCRKELIFGNKIQFQLEKQSQLIFYLDRIDKNKPYNYKMHFYNELKN